MITFAPIPDCEAIARLLDDKRLNAQRTESGALLKWLRHPDQYPKFQNAGYCTMWRGHLEALAVYYNAMFREWIRRGYNAGISRLEETVLGMEAEVRWPGWWGDERLHSNHRVALLSKDPEHYGRLGWAEQPAPDRVYEYLWPDRDPETGDWTLRPPKSGKSMPKSRIVREQRKQLEAKRKRAEGGPGRGPAASSKLADTESIAPDGQGETLAGDGEQGSRSAAGRSDRGVTTRARARRSGEEADDASGDDFEPPGRRKSSARGSARVQRSTQQKTEGGPDAGAEVPGKRRKRNA